MLRADGEFLQGKGVGAFRDLVELVGGDVAEGLFRAARPIDFDKVHGFGFAEAEDGAQITLREVAAAAGDFAELRDAASRDADSRSHGIAVALDAH